MIKENEAMRLRRSRERWSTVQVARRRKEGNDVTMF